MASPDPKKRADGLPEQTPVLLACLHDLLLRVHQESPALRASGPFQGPDGDSLAVLALGGRTVAEILASAGVVPSTKSFIEQELSGARQRLVDEMTALLDGKIKELDRRDQKLTGQESLMKERERAVEAKERDVATRAAVLDARPLQSVPRGAAPSVEPSVASESTRIIEAARATAQQELTAAQELVAAELKRADDLSNANSRTVLEIKRQAVEEMMISMGMGIAPTVSEPAVESIQPAGVEVVAVTTSLTTASEPEAEAGVDDSEEADGDSREPGLGIAKHILMIHQRLTTGHPAPRDGDDGTMRKHMAKYGAETQLDLCKIAQRVVDRHDPRAVAKASAPQAGPGTKPAGKKRFQPAFEKE